MVYVKHTWQDSEVITAEKLNNLEDGSYSLADNLNFTGSISSSQPITAGLKSRPATFTDFAEVATAMQTYAGFWTNSNNVIANSPNNNDVWTVINVQPAVGQANGFIWVYKYQNISEAWYTSVTGGKIVGWKKVAFDNTTGVDKRATITKTPATIKYWTSRHTTNQDSIVIGNQMWSFTGQTSDHSVSQAITVYDLDATKYSSGGFYKLTDKSHNLGHVNGADFIYSTRTDYAGIDLTKGYFVAYNGSGLPPEVSLFKDVSQSTTSLDVANSTNIIFKEGTKQLNGDGSISFGGNFRTLFLTRIVDANTIGLRVISLGTGSTDYSDVTSDKSDMSAWGTFKSGKTDYEYNGTAKIVKDIKIDTNGLDSANQPQGQTYYNGYLYLGVGFTNSSVIKVSVFEDYGKIEKVIYPNITNFTGGETEAVSVYNGDLYVQAIGIPGQGDIIYQTPLY